MHQSSRTITAYCGIMLDPIIIVSILAQPAPGTEAFADSTSERIIFGWSLFCSFLRRHLDVLEHGLPDRMSVPMSTSGNSPSSRRKHLTLLTQGAEEEISTSAHLVLYLLGCPAPNFPESIRASPIQSPATARDRMLETLPEDGFEELKRRGMSVCCFCGRYKSREKQEDNSSFPTCSRCKIRTYCSKECQRAGKHFFTIL